VVDTPIVIDLSPYKDLVRDGSNSIAIHGLNSSASTSEFLVRPSLSVNQTLTPTPQPVGSTQVVTARTYDGSTRSAPEQLAVVQSPFCRPLVGRCW
jgi:hypothetical protein